MYNFKIGDIVVVTQFGLSLDGVVTNVELYKPAQIGRDDVIEVKLYNDGKMGWYSPRELRKKAAK